MFLDTYLGLFIAHYRFKTVREMCISWQVTQVISLLIHISSKSRNGQKHGTGKYRMYKTKDLVTEESVSTVNVRQNSANAGSILIS